MNKLIILLAGLACAHAAPQFVFVLPPEFLQQMQKPVGDAAQLGQQPNIPAIPIESLLGSSSALVESIAAAPVITESLQPVATPIVEVEQQQTAESAPVVITELPPVDAVAEVALALAKVQKIAPVVKEAPVETTITEAVSPVMEEGPISETLVEETVTVVQETPVEEVIVEEVFADVQETPVDTPVQEITSDPIIAIQDVAPVEEIVIPSIDKKVTENLAVKEVVIVEDVNTNTVEEIIIVEEVIPSSTAAPIPSPVSTTTSPVPSITSAPVKEVVDPRMNVDPRFRNYIYVNDAPDVVAAKVALFNLQAASLPKQQVI